MSKLTIDLYCDNGSPMGLIPPDIYGRGVGGAELAMMSWAETMAGHGHKMRVYNNPKQAGDYNGVEYLPQSAFVFSADRDVFIAYRSPNPYTRNARAAVKLFWSTDQYTTGDFATDVFPYVDRTVCISPFHVDYHISRYGVDPALIGYFDLGVRVEEYQQEIEKIPGRCIYCSVPNRGLEILRMMWPKIKARVPNASLVITSDYTLWGAPGPLNHEHRLNWLGVDGVEFMGAIPRKQLVEEQLKAEVMPFCCTYEELFCISAAECQVAGAYPITTSLGALPTTNQWGALMPNNVLDNSWQGSYIETVSSLLDGSLEVMSIPKMISDMRREAQERFDWQTICNQWEHLIASGEYATKETLEYA